ncbi:ABC-type transport auxiliary lipoprotein family protein [Yoonia sp.]|uniref:ABC-type transport auxiliary lipoprotein family protein n=1 Tax=Yoonia sp. TaxID=2212373 RepID=UPI002FD95535
MIHNIKPFIALLLLLAPGCGAISALDSASEPLEVYELRAPSLQTAVRRSRTELVVEEPTASGALAVERIMIQPRPLQAQYLPGVRWADTAPTMLQTLLVRSLTETGALGSVGRRPVGTIADFAVLSELTDFQAETADGNRGAEIVVRASFRIVRERDARVIATRTFERREQADDTGVETIVPAFDRATSALIAEVVPWILGQL